MHKPELRLGAAGGIAIKPDGDALSDASNFADRPPFDGCDGRVDGAEDKDAGNAHMLERLANDARLERGDDRR